MNAWVWWPTPHTLCLRRRANSNPASDAPINASEPGSGTVNSSIAHCVGLLLSWHPLQCARPATWASLRAAL